MSDSAELGERKIIEIVWKQLEKMPDMPVAFGDDVSACNIGDERVAVLKTDLLVAETDVPAGMSLWQAARKAVVMNISDFAAKGVKPAAVLVSLGLPKKLKEKDIEQIGAGLNAGAREYNSYVIGGDTGEASDLMINVSLFGLAKKDMLMLRKGARAGDVVAVTGFFGKTAAGLKILLGDFRVSEIIRETLVGSVLMPRARLREGLALCSAKAVTAAIDSSDGLAWCLHEVAKASNVGFLIDRLPVAREVERFAKANVFDLVELALYGGEEYELVLTIRPECWAKAERAVGKVGGKLLPIGMVTEEKKIVLKMNGKRRLVEPRGYEHFKM